MLVPSLDTRNEKPSEISNIMDYVLHPLTWLLLGMDLDGFRCLKQHTAGWLKEISGTKHFMHFYLLSQCHWLQVITKNADTDCSKKISQENQWIN
jgi:hypothetical protein